MKTNRNRQNTVSMKSLIFRFYLYYLGYLCYTKRRLTSQTQMMRQFLTSSKRYLKVWRVPRLVNSTACNGIKDPCSFLSLLCHLLWAGIAPNCLPCGCKMAPGVLDIKTRPLISTVQKHKSTIPSYESF